jgi:hypothetical protein
MRSPHVFRGDPLPPEIKHVGQLVVGLPAVRPDVTASGPRLDGARELPSASGRCRTICARRGGGRCPFLWAVAALRFAQVAAMAGA